MKYLHYFNIKNFKYDLINKFHYTKTKNLPKLNKIILHFRYKNATLENLASSLLAFKIIVSKKGKLITSRKSNVLLKIKKGNPIGCKSILKNQSLFNFLNKIKLNNLINKTKKINKITNLKKKSFSFEIEDTFNTFNELKTNFYFFNMLNNLEVNFVIKTFIKKEIIFILKSYKLFLIK